MQNEHANSIGDDVHFINLTLVGLAPLGCRAVAGSRVLHACKSNGSTQCRYFKANANWIRASWMLHLFVFIVSIHSWLMHKLLDFSCTQKKEVS